MLLIGCLVTWLAAGAVAAPDFSGQWAIVTEPAGSRGGGPFGRGDLQPSLKFVSGVVSAPNGNSGRHFRKLFRK